MQLGDLLPADVSLPHGARAIDIEGVSADSRAVAPGFLFAALSGTQTDGARFVREADRPRRRRRARRQRTPWSTATCRSCAPPIRAARSR